MTLIFMFFSSFSLKIRLTFFLVWPQKLRVVFVLSEDMASFGVYLCLQPLGGCLLLSAWNNRPVPGILPGEQDYWLLPKYHLGAGPGCRAGNSEMLPLGMLLMMVRRWPWFWCPWDSLRGCCWWDAGCYRAGRAPGSASSACVSSWGGVGKENRPFSEVRCV